MRSLHSGYPTILLILVYVMMASCNSNELLLYLHHYAFYPQKVMIAMYEKKLHFKQQVVDLTKGENYKPWYLEINCRGEVPVLKDGMKIIPDSARIIDYLEDNFSGDGHPRLIPQDPAQKQKMNRFREMIDAINGNTVTFGTLYFPELAQNQKMPFISPVRSFMKAAFEKTPERLTKVAEENPKCKEVLLEKVAQQEKTRELVSNKESYVKLLDQVDETLTEVENELAAREDKENWLVSRDFTVADVALTMLLERLNLIGLAHRFWESGKKPELSNYWSRVRQRDSYKSTVPGFMTHLKSMVGYKIMTGVVSVAAGLVIVVAVYWWKTKK